MRTLQYRIALIITVSIVAVMLVATLATSWVLSAGDATRMAEPMAQHIAFSSDLLVRGVMGPHEWPQRWAWRSMRPDFRGRFDPGPDGGPVGPDGPGGPGGPMHREEVADTPEAGRARPDFTEALRAALVKQQATGEVAVTENVATGALTASYKLPNGRWGLFDFPRPMGMPPSLVIAVSAWMAVVVAGVIAVALFMARRVTRPFTILEAAVASVGPDGVLPHIKETGSGEARHTAHVLNQLSERLRLSMESRMRLVAAAGHDLRTPMTRMRLRSEFLPEDERESWLADLDELEQIADSAIHLVREEGTSEEQSQIALDRLLRETVSELSSAKLPVALTNVVPGTVRAAPLSLRRALRNLITNAATHGGGARVELVADDRTVHVIIDDNGPGIPTELMPHVFEPFFRVDAGRAKPTKGAGLGLAIAKEIIERFGGSIEIENRGNGGLRQSVTLARIA